MTQHLETGDPDSVRPVGENLAERAHRLGNRHVGTHRGEIGNRLGGLGHLAWSGSRVTARITGGFLVDFDPALPFYIGGALSALGLWGAFSLCRLLDKAGK